MVNSVDITTRLTLCFVSLCSLLGYYLPVIVPSNKHAINKNICIALPYVYVALMLSSQIKSEQDFADSIDKQTSVLSTTNIKQFSTVNDIINSIPELVLDKNDVKLGSQVNYFMPDKSGSSLHEQFYKKFSSSVPSLVFQVSP